MDLPPLLLNRLAGERYGTLENVLRRPPFTHPHTRKTMKTPTRRKLKDLVTRNVAFVYESEHHANQDSIRGGGGGGLTDGIGPNPDDVPSGEGECDHNPVQKRSSLGVAVAPFRLPQAHSAQDEPLVREGERAFPAKAASTKQKRRIDTVTFWRFQRACVFFSLKGRGRVAR